MSTTAELQMLIDARHTDPHTLLGLHETDSGLVMRVLNPHASRVTLIEDLPADSAKEALRLDIPKIHDHGLFEVTVPDRKEWFRYKLETEFYNGGVWTEYDPYEFRSGISDMDIYLFSAGMHYQIYEKLGANVTEIDGVKGVLFGVWAPNALRVSVVGSFNEWDARRHMMRRLENSGIWEIFIPGLCDGDLYCFELVNSKGDIIRKTDPYGKYSQVRPDNASRVFDIKNYQWGDAAWMAGERPDRRTHEEKERDAKEQAERELAAREAEKSGGIIGRLFGKKKEEQPQVVGEPAFGTDAFCQPINIYEVHLGSWKRSEYPISEAEPDVKQFLTYRQIADQLVPYVQEMGYTYVELLPVEEHPLDESWGYQVTGYYAPTSRFGTPADLMYLIDRFHQAGIGVILDWVPAHFPKDGHGLARFDGTALYEHEDPRKGEHAEWGTYIYNFGRKEVMNFLIANALYWLEAFHIDGLRVDAVTSMLYLDYAKEDGEWLPNEYGGRENLEAVEFLKHMNSIVHGRCPNAITIAEESTTWPGITAKEGPTGLGFDFKWNMGWMHDFLDYMKLDPIYRKFHHNDMTFAMTYAYNENYVLVLSHDEVVHTKAAMLAKMPGDEWQRFANLRAGYGFMFAHPGKKLLFMGGEIGTYNEWNEQKELDWDLLQYPIHKGLQEFVKDLNKVYAQNNAFWIKDGDDFGFEWINADDADRSIYSMVRRGARREDTLLIVVNFTPNVYEEFSVGVPFEGFWEEILNSDDSHYGGSGVTNEGIHKTSAEECDGRDNRLMFRLGPLCVSVWKNIG